MHQISLKLVYKNIVCAHICCVYVWCEEEKYEENLISFRDLYLENYWGYSFQIWYVRYCICIKTLKYVHLVEIGAI